VGYNGVGKCEEVDAGRMMGEDRECASITYLTLVVFSPGKVVATLSD
jgi:hypothetical protein